MAVNGVNDKYLTDKYTNRDIFGVVRGRCSGVSDDPPQLAQCQRCSLQITREFDVKFKQ